VHVLHVSDKGAVITPSKCVHKFWYVRISSFFSHASGIRVLILQPYSDDNFLLLSDLLTPFGLNILCVNAWEHLLLESSDFFHYLLIAPEITIDQPSTLIYISQLYKDKDSSKTIE
ncbi:12326_t:CDS:1, partial [Ambispora leptoticha]